MADGLTDVQRGFLMRHSTGKLRFKTFLWNYTYLAIQFAIVGVYLWSHIAEAPEPVQNVSTLFMIFMILNIMLFDLVNLCCLIGAVVTKGEAKSAAFNIQLTTEPAKARKTHDSAVTLIKAFRPTRGTTIFSVLWVVLHVGAGIALAAFGHFFWALFYLSAVAAGKLYNWLTCYHLYDYATLLDERKLNILEPVDAEVVVNSQPQRRAISG